MNRLPKVGAVYSHYRNSSFRYNILHTGWDEATKKPVVIYQENQHPQNIWVRTLESWYHPVELATGEKVDRYVELKNKE